MIIPPFSSLREGVKRGRGRGNLGVPERPNSLPLPFWTPATQANPSLAFSPLASSKILYFFFKDWQIAQRGGGGEKDKCETPSQLIRTVRGHNKCPYWRCVGIKRIDFEKTVTARDKENYLRNNEVSVLIKRVFDCRGLPFYLARSLRVLSNCTKKKERKKKEKEKGKRLWTGYLNLLPRLLRHGCILDKGYP